jgi:hypothetical protein
MMTPEALKKHDGRVVAFDSARLASSIARAACASDDCVPPESAKRLGAEIAHAVAVFLSGEGVKVPASADVRAFVVKLLRETNNATVADAYSDFGRAASSLLWRIRVADAGVPAASGGGQPWDRRRLLESFRSAGIARDPAGEGAREVERRLVALGQERISPALIHALACLVLSQRSIDSRCYIARRLAYSLSAHVPHFDPRSVELIPLPPDGPALEALWLQSVHSADVTRAVTENTLSLEPYVSSPADDLSALGFLDAVDPIRAEMSNRLREWCAGKRAQLFVRVDSAERMTELARLLALLPASLIPPPSSVATLTLLYTPAAATRTRTQQRAWPVTLNAAGLLVREALRDRERATVRLARVVGLAAQAHREREEYFNFSPVRGRQLPVAIAGLWNAVAWLQGETFDAPRVTRAARSLAETLITVVRGALETLRDETGMELTLIGTAPVAATRGLWRRDREYFLRDGITLDANATYDGGPGLQLLQGYEDIGERVEFSKKAGANFDEPPTLTLKVPLGDETDVAAWRDVFSAFGQAGVPRLDLMPGGGIRVLKTISRAVRTHLQEYPLFQ